MVVAGNMSMLTWFTKFFFQKRGWMLIWYVTNDQRLGLYSVLISLLFYFAPAKDTPNMLKELPNPMCSKMVSSVLRGFMNARVKLSNWDNEVRFLGYEFGIAQLLQEYRYNMYYHQNKDQ